MTPPSPKPDATPNEVLSTSDPEPSLGERVDAPIPMAGRPAGLRQHPATLELRVAARRIAATAEAVDSNAQSAGALVQAGAAIRLGPRARQRAARAALAEAQANADQAAVNIKAATQEPRKVNPPEPPQVGMSRSDPVMPSITDPTTGAILTDDGFDSVVSAMTAPVRKSDAAARIVPGQIETVIPVAVPQDDSLIGGDLDEDDGTVGGVEQRRIRLRAERRAARLAMNNDAANYVVVPTVAMAHMRPRHYGVIALFLLMVMLPTLSYSLYLWTKAANQYQSNVGFGSRTEEAASTFDFLGALGGVSKNGSSDMDILNQFIISQELVSKLDKELDLKAMYSKASDDPLNSFVKGGTIEDLLEFWQRMVIVNYDKGTGLMSLEVFAFDPQDAKKIAEAILTESTKIINDLSLTAQVDTTRYSKDALTAAEQKLGDARLAVLDYQVRNRIVDPTNTIASQNGVISTLNQQLATTQIELDMLAGTVGTKDVRIATLNRRIEVIKNRIAEEQSKVGTSTDGTASGFAELIQEFERLKVDQDFAERAYLSSLAAYDQAINDAQHKTRYLAAYVTPTLAEAPTAPNRPLTALLAALIGFLLWAVIVLTYYALRDRR